MALEDLPISNVRGRGRGRGRLIVKVNASPWQVGIGGDVVDACNPKTKIFPPAAPFKLMTTITDEIVKSNRSVVESGEAPLPARLLSDSEQNIPVKIVGVDFIKKNVLVTFEDELSVKIRRDLAWNINEFYKSTKATELHIPIEDLTEGDAVVVGDVRGNFHRVIISHANCTGNLASLIDIDTNKDFQMNKTLVFKMTPEIRKIFFQVVRCVVTISNSSIMKSWKEENFFLLNVPTFLDNSVISTLEMHINEVLSVKTVRQTDSANIFSICIDIFGSQHLKNHFISSLLFFTIPRVPAVGQMKIAVITNIREDGKIDAMIYDKVAIGVREAIKKLQESNILLGSQCGCETRFYAGMIESYNIRNFLAPLPGDGSQLHRVKVVGIEFSRNVKVKYVDLGKQLSIPLKNLCVPLRSSFVPELLEFIQPQAVTLRLHDLLPQDPIRITRLKSTLEGRPCYIQTVKDDDREEPPVVEIWTEIDEKVVSLISVVRSYNESEHWTVGKVNSTAGKVYNLDVLRNVAEKWKTLRSENNIQEGESTEVKNAKCNCCRRSGRDDYASASDRFMMEIPA